MPHMKWKRHIKQRAALSTKSRAIKLVSDTTLLQCVAQVPRRTPSNTTEIRPSGSHLIHIPVSHGLLDHPTPQTDSNTDPCSLTIADARSPEVFRKLRSGMARMACPSRKQATGTLQEVAIANPSCISPTLRSRGGGRISGGQRTERNWTIQVWCRTGLLGGGEKVD